MPKVSTVFDVEGMSCNHCVNSIKKAVGELDGVGTVDVDLTTKKVRVDYNDSLVNDEKIKAVIEDQGYDVK
jgi:copper chaperone